MWLVFGLGMMGLLVGFVAGMSSSAIVNPLIALLFAFVGGSIFALLSKLSVDDRKLAGKMVIALSSCCLLGVIVGVRTSRGQYLVPAPLRSAFVDQCLSADPPPACFLRSGTASEADLIDADKRSGKLTADEAYDKLNKLIQDGNASSGGR
jgi:hypothetical protein